MQTDRIDTGLKIQYSDRLYWYLVVRYYLGLAAMIFWFGVFAAIIGWLIYLDVSTPCVRWFGVCV